MNNSTQPRDYAEIAATFYDVFGKMVGWATSFTAASTLDPGQRSPFEMVVGDWSISLTVHVSQIKHIAIQYE